MRRETIAPGGLTRDAVPAAFDLAAAHYDRLVAANPGYHEHLRLSARRMGLPDNGRGLRLLDAGCGTGASTAALLSVARHADIVAVDASAQMLAHARAKPWPDAVHFAHTRVEDLPAAGIPGPFDGIFAAYLLRNLADPDRQLRLFAQLLRPGAPLTVHEYSVRDSRRARLVWHVVCWTVIIPAGRALTGDATLYRYLWRSVTSFDGASRLRRRLLGNGYATVVSDTMPGWQHNIVHTFRATTPAGFGIDGSGLR